MRRTGFVMVLVCSLGMSLSPLGRFETRAFGQGDATPVSTADAPVAKAEPATATTGAAAAAAETTASKPADAAPAPRTVSVVSLGVSGDLSESVAPPGLFGEIQKSLRQTIEKLERAATDDGVAAIVLRIRDVQIGRGRLHELRQAIDRVRRGGKRVVADLQFATTADYLVACACDEIIMPESGTLYVPGVRAEVTFYKSLFDKVGIQADILQVGDFKGAAEPYTRSGMSDAFRKQFELVIDDFYDQMVDTIATTRRLPRDQVVALIDRGLLTAQAARDAGLIDRVGYEDDYRAELAKRLGATDVKLVRNYAKKKVDTDFSGMVGMMKFMELLTGTESKSRGGGDKRIAVIYAVGEITTGTSSVDLMGGQTLGGDTIVSALRAAEKDAKVVAIVLRIDSPGGSALASDLIWQQITQCQKPVVASMGDMAASGGYYIAMGCDKIVAEPGTLTGSIGVVGGKVTTGALMQKVGVSTEVVSRGKNSGIFSSQEPFRESEREAFRQSMELTYSQFTAKAAAGRKMDPQRLQSLAGGRIWSGRQAQQHGLVDSLGTLEDAVRVARDLAHVESSEETDWLILPKSRSFLEQLLDEPDGDAQARSPWQDSWTHLAGPWAKDVSGVVRMFREPILVWLPYRIEIR